MQCIFSKSYSSAITEFEKCIDYFGNGIVMDHSFQFYIALSKLQLNQFEEAESILIEDIDNLTRSKNWDWVHHLDLFYLGITQLEQTKYGLAIETFDDCLDKYPRFSDAKLYKSKALRYLGDTIAADHLMKEAELNFLAGYTINEDNEVYEKYPYQVNWNHIGSLK